MIMFADGGGGQRQPGPVPHPDEDAPVITRELLDRCRDNARRADRLVRRLDPRGVVAPAEAEGVRLDWAIRALEGSSEPDTEF